MNKMNIVPDGSLARPDFLGMAEGPVAIRMTNDYLFHALLQDDNEALKGLICALLKLDVAQVRSVVITNPIELGAYVRTKDFILDVKVLLNHSAIINLELQVINRHNWPERSLSYLCRAFDNLNSGQGYHMVKPVIHIGLLDFTLFPRYPEFYATYQMLNVKNHAVYSDKLRLSVVDLTHINLATEEDRRYHIDSWAAFFKAATWEEIKMIAQKDESIAKAANTIWKLSREEKIRLQCQAREDYYRNQRDMQNYMEEQAEIIAQREETIARQGGDIVRQEETIAQQEGTIAQQAEQLSEKDAVIEALKVELQRLREDPSSTADK